MQRQADACLISKQLEEVLIVSLQVCATTTLELVTLLIAGDGQPLLLLFDDSG